MSYRSVNSSLEASLLNNEGHTYIHLIKFEKPSVDTELSYKEGSKLSKKATTYAYLTDAGFPVSFNDGSVDVDGNFNGSQNYVPGKILSIGTVNETIEAKASTMSLSLASSALSAQITTNFTFTSTEIVGLVDLLQSGFSVGDTIEFSGSGANNGVYVRIDGFENGNKTIRYTTISGTVTNSASAAEYTISFASAEIDSLTLSKTSTDYSSYLNREVFIYRAHLNPSTGTIVGAPFVIFKGIITNASIDDDVTKGSKITWSLTSHWGDFVQVVGRITSDHAHRGLDTGGVSQEDAVFRPEYAADYGFRHAEQAVNVAATYQVPETRYKMKKRGGIAGALGLKRMVEYTVMVDRDVDLEFNLGAKYIPVVYGVQKVSGIPIFADGDKGDAQKVYVAQAISEGPIHGILDLHIDSNPIICVNGPDSLDRSSGDSQVLCVGRADRGDVLVGGSATNASGDFEEQVAQLAQELLDSRDADDYNEALMIAYQILAYSEVDETATGGAGILHEKKFNLDSPLSTEIQFHAGRFDQHANSFFAAKGLSGGFKLQSILYRDKPREFYWSPQHRLLDTAYTTMNFTVADGEFTIPDYEYIVKGRVLQCFNYDYSYSGSGTASNFKLGESVTLHKTSDNSQLGSTSVQIIDKWSFYTDTGRLQHRFRFDKNYQLESVRGDSNGDVKNFYMKDVGNNKFFFSAYDAVVEDINSDPIENNTFQSQTSITNTSHSTVQFNSFSRTVWSTQETYPGSGEWEAVEITVTDYRVENLPTGLAEFTLGDVLGMKLTYPEGDTEVVLIPYISYTGDKITFPRENSQTTSVTIAAKNKFNRATSWQLFSADTVKLDANSATTDDAYNGQKLVIREKDPSNTDNVRQEFNKVITDYQSSTKLAKLSSALTINPDSTSLFDYTIEGDLNISEDEMFAAFEDRRVSINPAIQLLDYLTNKRYGKGLDLEDDIDLESFLSVARTCDERSKVTIITSTNPGTIANSTYKYPATGDLLFQGTVDKNPTSFTAPDGNTYYEVTFKNVIGKLLYKWNDARTFYPGEVLYYEGTAFTTDLSSPATISATQRDTHISARALDDSSSPFTLTDVDTPSNTIDIFLDSGESFGSSSGNPAIRRNSGAGMNAPGYSLYDSDDCKYWVYLGWDEPEQRYVTRHQTNLTVDTSQPVFNNINGMLQQFNGMLRYSNGKYTLAIKAKAPADSHFTTDFVAKNISEDEIIGKVKVNDTGSKKTFNSVNATIVDPANKFGGRGITFMNSDYLKQDRGVKKQGNYNVPGITNYFNARMNIKQLLDESRYGLTINFTVDQKGYLLLAGDIIRLSYSRFGWQNKYFRINSLNFQANGLVQVVADEHNDDAYLIEHLDTGRTGGTLEGGNQGSIPTSKPSAPTLSGTLTAAASDDRAGYIELNWANGENFNYQAHRTQIARNATNVTPAADASNVTIIAEVQTNNYLDNTDRTVSNTNGIADSTPYYYWVRHIYNTTGGMRLDKSTTWLALGQGTSLPIAQTEIEDGVTVTDGGIAVGGSGAVGASINSVGTGYASGNDGFFLGWDDSNSTEAFKFFVGETGANGERLTFDGAGNLEVTGTITADDGEIGGWTIDSDAIYAGTKVSADSTFAASGDITLFSDGSNARISTEQFRIDNDGSAHFKGEVNITNGGSAPTISGSSVSGKGILLEPVQADVFFGDATATDIADHRYVFFDQSEGTLSIKGTLAPTAFDFGNTSDITLPTNIPASAVVNGSIGPSAFTQEVWNQIDSRQGTGSGGFYSNASGHYLGEAAKYITITNADHGEENVTLEAIINDSFTYPRNYAAGSSNVKITISFEAKKSSEGSSAWAHVGPVISTANDFYAVPTLYQYATNYTINATYTAILTTGLDDNVDYDFRVKIVRGHTNSVFRAYTDGGANDSTGTPVLFEAVEQSTGGLSSGNLTTDETVAHRGDADTYLQFTDDQIDIYAGGVHFATFEEDTADSITLRQDTTIIGDLKLGDTREIQFGDDNDLKIVHSGGTGTIQNDTGDLYIKNRTEDGDIYFQSDDGTGVGTDTYFFLDGGNKNTTFLEEVIISNDLTVTGDLNITGEINSNNVTNLQVDDKTITVNNGGGTTTSDGAGLIVDRGSETDASFTWNETDDLFELNFPAKITKSTQNAPVLHLYHSYDGGYRDTLLIENPNDRDAGITFKTGGGQYEMWIDSNGDDSLIFSPGDGTSSIAMELYQNKNVDFGGSINVTGGIEFNPNGDNILANTDGNRDLFLFERNGSTSWQVWHTTDQHLNFDPANSAYKLQYDGYDVWHRGDLTDTNKTNYDTAYTYSQVGHLPLTGGTISGNVSFGENDKVYFGTDNDFQIRHAGTTYLDNTSGNLNIRNLADDMDIVLSCDDGSGGIKTYMTLDGSIDTLKAQTKFQVLPGENRTNGFDYSATNTISNQNHTMMRLDFNFSGTETHTTDNYKYGLYIDYDSSDSGGDTNNETRLFPLYIDARNLAGGTADRLDAAYLYARNNGSADMAQLRGLNSYALALNSGGTVTNLYGSQSTATAQPSGTGSVTNVFGAHNTAQANGSSGQTIGQLIGASNHATTNSNNTCDITSMFGSWNEVQLDATNNAHTISNMYAVYALIDENDTGSDHTVNNSYLFFGDYQGNLTDGSTYSGINAFGVYIADDVENRFMGRVRAKEFDVGGVLVIDTNRTAKLTGIKHDNTGDTVIDLDDNTYVKINNPDGTEAIKIGGGGSTDAMNTYKNDIHRFYKANGTTELAQFYQGMASFYDNDVDANSYYADGKFQSGTDNADGFWVGNTQIVEGDTRNLKNIGSIESSSIEVGDAAIDTTSTTTTATTQVTIDSFATTSFRSARYTVQVTNTTDSTYHLTEILLIHDGTTPSITEYGTIFTGSAEAAFDADISSGNVRLLATPTTNDSMTFKVVRHCITV